MSEGVVGQGETIMAGTGTVGSVSVSLHPLVILNISEHWTRQRAQEGKPVQGKGNYRQSNLSFSTFLEYLYTQIIPYFILVVIIDCVVS